jgi:hypothetical protein
MPKSCGTCIFYEPLKGEPPAGYCDFAERPVLPFWMDSEIMAVRAIKGSDVVPADGAECDAFQLNPSR